MDSKVAVENESLYHIKRTIIDYLNDPSGATRTTDILKTYVDLPAAKKAAKNALHSEGYLNDDFAVYEESPGTEEWDMKRGGGVLVWAKAPAGQEFEVRLDTKPNVLGLKGNTDSAVEGHLHYVLQTTINYDNDRTGAFQNTEVEGTFTTRAAAIEAAKLTLLDEKTKKSSFAEYDEKDQFKDEWPYGDEVLVHAVGDTGENFLVAVKAQPHNHANHNCEAHGGKACRCKCDKTEEGCKHKPCKHAECKASK